ncbi:unnamed protein product [Urochloa humidicola]
MAGPAQAPRPERASVLAQAASACPRAVGGEGGISMSRRVAARANQVSARARLDPSQDSEEAAAMVGARLDPAWSRALGAAAADGSVPSEIWTGRQ